MVLVAGTGGMVVVALVGGADMAGKGMGPVVEVGCRQGVGAELELGADGVVLGGVEAGLTSHLDFFLGPPFFSSSRSSLFLFSPAACC